jgi:hypothetical protein
MEEEFLKSPLKTPNEIHSDANHSSLEAKHTHQSQHSSDFK